MTQTPLITAPDLLQLLAQTQTDRQLVRIFDCSFDLADLHAGKNQYLQAHIPGAIHTSLAQDLSASHGTDPSKKGAAAVLTVGGADTPASGGRHPLPNRERFATWLSRVGFSNGMKAVVYDRNRSLYCGRLWWMLKWAGHADVVILDGGLQAWQEVGGDIKAGEEPAHFQGNFLLSEPLVKLVDAEYVRTHLASTSTTLIDARAPARFKGETEPLDPVAGHIPGAVNRPFDSNFENDGRFKSPEQLKEAFAQLFASKVPTESIHYCGSGVSALPNMVAMEIAGLGHSTLYAGSWSDWSSNESRPVEKG